MPTFKLVAENAGRFGAAGPAFALRLRFPLTRTQFLSATVDPLVETPGAGVGRVDLLGSSSVLIFLAFQRPIKPGGKIRVLLEYMGEPPGAPKLKFVPLPPPTDANERVTAAAKRRVQSIRRIRVEEIEATALDGRKPQKDFFREYDEQVNPQILLNNPSATEEDKSLAAEIVGATTLLIRRVISRVGGVTPTERMNADLVRRLSDLQLTLFRQHFPAANSGIDIPSFDAAFVAFSTGQLMDDSGTLWNGRPDSANFFLFAEFAICAIDANESASSWMGLLPTFVKCQGLYTEVFAPFCQPDRAPKRIVPKELRTYGMYGVQNSNPPPPAALAALIQSVEAGFRSVPNNFSALVQRHAENARDAFPRGEVGTTNACDAIEEG